MRSVALAGIATSFAVSVPGMSFAQDTAVEEIFITGSRIARKDLIATSPVNVISAVDLEISGINQIATILNELPQAGVPGSVDTATNFRTSTSGLNTVDLRNLGTNRTLVLVNGRRHVGGSAGSPTVDLSMIPAPLVSRVEIVTGGASAVYGSEAMAGVINVIMKDDFEGLEFTTRFGTSQDGGADETDLSLTFGSDFAGGRGNAIGYVGYSERGILEAGDRDISAHDATNSSFGPKGNFFLTDFSASYTLDEGTGLFDKPFMNAEDGFDRNAVRLIRVPTTRTQYNGNFTYDINDNMRFFSETGYSELTAKSRLEPSIVGFFISVGSIPNINMPLDNPFFPAELAALVLANDPLATEIPMFRRFTEIGPRTSDVQRQTFRTAFGIEGNIPDGWVASGWDYEAYFQYGNNTQNQTNGGVYNALNVLQALDAEPDGLGGFQCVDSLARDLGCAPVNFFGPGTVSGDALDWVQVDSQLTTRMTQRAAGAFMSGTLFEAPAGDVDVAVGVEWRKEMSIYNSDSLAASGLTSGNSIPNTAGDYNVSEFFGEAIVPLVSGAPFAEYLGLEFAARYADYSTVGGTVAYKISGEWRPVETLRFRGGYNTAIRAPFIDELFDPGSETFRSFNDPCALGGLGGLSGDAVTVYQTQSAAVQAACATIPGSATLDPELINITSAGGFAAGNPDLTEEEAETITFGFVYSPTDIPGFNITVDYFEITIENAINGFSAQTTLDQCVRQASFPNNAFCDLIERDPVTGLVLRVDDLQINVAEFKASGIDFAMDYSFDVQDVSVKLGLNGTRSIENDFIPFAGGSPVDSQGEIGVPDWKVNATALIDWQNVRVGWSTRYIDQVNIENDQPVLGSLDAHWYNDIHARYVLDADGSYEVFAGIDNLFDKKPPFLGQGVPGDVTGTNTAADVYDVVGRYGYVGFKARF